MREAQHAVRTVEEGLRRSMGKRDTKEAAWEAMLADLDPDQGPDSTGSPRNPRHLDTIGGGRTRVSYISIDNKTASKCSMH